MRCIFMAIMLTCISLVVQAAVPLRNGESIHSKLKNAGEMAALIDVVIKETDQNVSIYDISRTPFSTDKNHITVKYNKHATDEKGHFYEYTIMKIRRIVSNKLPRSNGNLTYDYQVISKGEKSRYKYAWLRPEETEVIVGRNVDWKSFSSIVAAMRKTPALPFLWRSEDVREKKLRKHTATSSTVLNTGFILYKEDENKFGILMGITARTLVEIVEKHCTFHAGEPNRLH